MTGILHLLPNRISERDVRETLPDRVLETARKTDYFLAENAKSARTFLKALAHPKPLIELTIEEIGHRPDPTRVRDWLNPIMSGRNACLVSESGCPAVADPGAGLIRSAHALGIRVVPLVGPCSILLTLMASGLNGQRFRFWGYLPVEPHERDKAILHLERESRVGETELFIETPYRNNKMLEALATTLNPETLLTVAVDVTGSKESIRTRKVRDWKQALGTLEKVPTVFALLSERR